MSRANRKRCPARRSRKLGGERASFVAPSCYLDARMSGMQMVKCLRCDTIAPLILTDAGGVQIDIEGDNIDVDVVDGFLTFLCGNCVTEEEANSFLLSLVATQL